MSTFNDNMGILNEKTPEVLGGNGGVWSGQPELQAFVPPASNTNIIAENTAKVKSEGSADAEIRDFEYGLCTRSKKWLRQVCHAESAMRAAWRNEGMFAGGGGGYFSVYTFLAEYIRNVAATQESAGYRGPAWAPFSWWDIDYSEDTLHQAIADAVKLEEFLCDFSGGKLTPANIQWWFSGEKGLHGGLSISVFGSTAAPSESFAAEMKAVACEIARRADISTDPIVYDVARILRGPNTQHDISGLYKIPLISDELRLSDAVTWIRERAKHPRLLLDTSAVNYTPQANQADAVLYTPPVATIPEFENFWREVAQAKTPPRYHQGWSPGYPKQPFPQLRKATQDFIANGAPQGERAMELFKAAADCTNNGMSAADVNTLLSGVGEKIGLEPKEANRQIQCGIERAQRDASLQQDTDDSQDTNLRDPATFQDFPLECLPEPVNRYVREKARALNQNPSGLAYALLVLAGACVGAKVKLKLGIDRLTAAILWFALIGISGSGKTPLINSCVALVSEMESIWHKQYVKEMRVYEREKAEYERSLKSKVVRARAGNEECVHVQPPPPKTEANLREFFGADCELEKITTKRADDFSSWLRTAPLNRRKKGVAEPYSTATVNKRVGYVKQLFRYAVQIDWLPKNPFTYVKGGESVNPDRWVYVASETMESVIDAAHLPWWRAILALGRFAGVRGSSELYGLLWEHVQWSSPGEPGSLLIKAEKNKRHGRHFRTVPMHPIVERELSALFHHAKEGATHVFPGMKKRTNLGTMTSKLVSAAGIPVWTNIWYNLRKSFCCDLMETGIDPTAYEAITDHSYAIAMKHYQIPHTKRLQKGYEKILASWGCTNSPPVAQKENVTETRGRILGRSWAGFRAEHRSAAERTFAQRDSQVLLFCGFMQEKQNACTNMQASEVENSGVEPLT